MARQRTEPSQPSAQPHRADGWTDRPQARLLVGDSEAHTYGELSRWHDTDTVLLVTCADGADVLYLAGSLRPDVIILSLILTTLDTPEVIRVLRAHTDAPVYLGIGDNEVDAAAAGLAAGATGLIGRPYQGRELDALLSMPLARAQTQREQQSIIRLGPLELDSPAFVVRINGKPMDLTLREFQILRFLMLHADRVVSQAEIRAEVWGSRGDAVTANTIAVHMGRLRTRLEGPAELISVRGVGYRLNILTATYRNLRAADPRSESATPTPPPPTPPPTPADGPIASGTATPSR